MFGKFVTWNWIMTHKLYFFLFPFWEMKKIRWKAVEPFFFVIPLPKQITNLTQDMTVYGLLHYFEALFRFLYARKSHDYNYTHFLMKEKNLMWVIFQRS